MGRRKFTAEFKTKIVLELLKEEKQIGELAAEHELSPNQLRNWKKDFLENAPQVFSQSKQEKELRAQEKALDEERTELMAKVGQLTIENDWLKKKNLKKFLGSTGRISLVSKNNKLPVNRQCQLLEINRTSFYYTPKEPDRERENMIKNRLDYWHTKMPYLGVRKLRKKLQNEDHIKVGRKLIKRYMDEMGIYAVYPKPNLSKRNKQHKIYPYLLRNLDINRANQVWAIDITYIKMGRSHMYLTAVIDWYSRYIVGWELSDTLDTAPVLAAVKEAINRYGTPEIINSDQGSQFTSADYTEYLKSVNIRQSMDGKARWIDNVIIERWFRSLKTEQIYTHEYLTPRDLRIGIREYIQEYNIERPHQTHDYLTPQEVYLGISKAA
ncbi:IS3 family transposase [Metallumcola ferriviriculae]|uniref:IS3 family transposase n=1 Tax=Metallumcola ferriviriculae TaxID=3039180 RepID=UPI00345B42D4